MATWDGWLIIDGWHVGHGADGVTLTAQLFSKSRDNAPGRGSPVPVVGINAVPAAFRAYKVSEVDFAPVSSAGPFVIQVKARAGPRLVRRRQHRRHAAKDQQHGDRLRGLPYPTRLVRPEGGSGGRKGAKPEGLRLAHRQVGLGRRQRRAWPVGELGEGGNRRLGRQGQPHSQKWSIRAWPTTPCASCK
jgi:hypothetical protein